MNRPLATSALALILGAGPALSDVTPVQVWDSLQANLEQMGYTIEIGDRNDQGTSLELSDIVMTVVDEMDGRTIITLPQIVMTDRGDGTVRSVTQGQVTLETRTVPAQGGDPIGFSMTMDLPGNETISSGTPEDLRHDMTVPTLAIAGRALDSENEVPLTATLSDLTTTQRVMTAADGSSTQTYDGRAASLEMQLTASGPAAPEADADGTTAADGTQETGDAGTSETPAPETAAPETAAPETGTPDAGTADASPDATADAAQQAVDTFQARVTVADLAFEGSGTHPGGEATLSNRPTEALQAGLGGQGAFTMGATTVTFDGTATDAEGQRNDTQGGLEAAGGSLQVGLTREGLSYEGALTDMAARLTATDMPFPVAYAAQENRFRLAVPVIASDEAQPFALTYVLDGLTLDDAIWQALDPQATLPRDPASLTIDLDGEALLSRDFLDADVPEPAPDAQPPLLPRSLNIRQVALDAVGASIDLTGALTFGDDPTTPTGTVSGTFGGVNGLLDRLAAMGVVPQEQLMGPRMMMAMFARPVEGAEDQLQTEIEFRADGSILANGQQIQ